MLSEPINFRLEKFEGPLDLLLHLISKNKVNIYDIPIADILTQYMEYINAWKEMDFEIAGEFIVMASELMLIKSKMLLPKPKTEEEDPRQNLAQALIEYKKAKELAVLLEERFKEFHGRIVKEPEVIEEDIIYSNHNLEMLYDAFARLVKRARANSENEEKEIKSQKALGNLISTKTYSVNDKIQEITASLSDNKNLSLFEIIKNSHDRAELVTVFVALLELLRSQVISIVSENENEDSENNTQNTFDLILTLNADMSVVSVDSISEDY